MELKEGFVKQVMSVISGARERAIRSVDSERAMMYWQVGKLIFEEE